MVVVAVRIDDILNRGTTPLELIDFISPQQWQLITDEVHHAFSEANFWSCCCEITICIIFLFPFIFCCHPCTTGILMKSQLDSKLRRLNASLFSGREVLRELNGNVLFNTDLIRMETVYIDRTNTGDFSKSGELAAVTILPMGNVQGPGQYADQSNYVAVVNPITDNAGSSRAAASQKQTMVVTVPPNAGPGSVLTVSAPNGSVLSVVVPQNSGPGRDIVVQY